MTQPGRDASSPCVSLPGVLNSLNDTTIVVSTTPIELSGGGLGGTLERPFKWVKVLDQTRCIGCHACTTACKSENQVPVGVNRTYVKSVDTGFFPQTKRNFQVTRCSMCNDAPCVAACPTGAMYRRPDGLVDFDKSICIGCKACIAACPYDAIFINPEDHSAEKCNFCTHRLDMGLEPACVVVCPVEAIIVGDLNDPDSKVSQIVNREPVAVRRPEKETRPKVFYKGADQTTLDPLAARRPEGDGYMWSQRRKGKSSQGVESGHPGPWQNSSAATVLSYDVPHKAPWDWRVSLYTWTKSISAGVYVVAVSLALLDFIDWDADLVRWVAPMAALLALAVTGALLISDLTHPLRFYMIFTRPQWRSWLVRGAFIITAYGLILGAHLTASILSKPEWIRYLAVPALLFGAMTAVYTAFLFSQSKGRDLWQSPLLPTHLLVQMTVAGSAAVVLLGQGGLPSRARAAAALTVAVSAGIHLLMTMGEITLGESTSHGSLAVWEMTRGRFRWYFASGVVLCAVALETSVLGPIGAIAALLGLLAHEHAYVQAGQAVPLA
ncbi:MAG: 4Fe-4S dicluster domain-containing protein [Actinobacteria bacterium]|nr:4Fe-4S dicluster domain-containing protein [Actinomycetota bacterium]